MLGFFAIMSRPGEIALLECRSASAVIHVVNGDVEPEIDGVSLAAVQNDTMAVPTHAWVQLANRSTHNLAFLFQVDDTPMQRRLGFYEASIERADARVDVQRVAW